MLVFETASIQVDILLAWNGIFGILSGISLPALGQNIWDVSSSISQQPQTGPMSTHVARNAARLGPASMHGSIDEVDAHWSVPGMQVPSVLLTEAPCLWPCSHGTCAGLLAFVIAQSFAGCMGSHELRTAASRPTTKLSSTQRWRKPSSRTRWLAIYACELLFAATPPSMRRRPR